MPSRAAIVDPRSPHEPGSMSMTDKKAKTPKKPKTAKPKAAKA
jgi:hypothetical protein